MTNNPENLDKNLEKMHVPEVKFEIPPVKREVNIIFDFCMHKNPSLDFSATVYNEHPELKKWWLE